MKERGFMAVQFLLGFGLTVLGLNGFFHFLPAISTQPEVRQFLELLETTGYFFPIVHSVEIFGGVLLMINWFVPLAIILLAPVILSLLVFYGFSAGGAMAVLFGVLALMEFFLAFGYRHYYQEIFVAKGIPDLSHNYITAQWM